MTMTMTRRRSRNRRRRRRSKRRRGRKQEDEEEQAKQAHERSPSGCSQFFAYPLLPKLQAFVWFHMASISYPKNEHDRLWGSR